MRTIFLSHAAVDSELAQYLEETLRASDPALVVFRTSRAGQIPAGRSWFENITGNLKAADCFVILLTPASQQRPWVCFETGAAYVTERTLVPVLGGGLTPAEVVEPLKNLQLLSLEVCEEASQAFAELGCTLPDPATFVERARELGARGRRAALETQGWEYVEHNGVRYAWAGPLASLGEEHGVPEPEGLSQRLRDAGLEPRYSTDTGLRARYGEGFMRVWQINEQFGSKREVIGSYDQVLLVRVARP